MMTTKLLMMGMAVTAMALTSCNKETNGWDESQNGEIRLSSSVAMPTRAFGMDEQINAGRKVAVYVDQVGGAQMYGKNELTADGAGQFTGGSAMFFPIDKGNVAIHALATNGTLDVNFPTAAITHTVSGDQTAAAGYAASDLLYSTKDNIAFSRDAIALDFYHMLTKVEVALTPGAGTPDLTGATVKILGTKLKADFLPVKSSDMALASRAAMITVPTTGNDAAPITIGNTASTDLTPANIKYNEAVIVPQTVAKDVNFIEVTLTNGSVLTHKLKSETVFASGKRHQYNITVNLTELTVSSTISNWDTTTPVEAGSAEM